MRGMESVTYVRDSKLAPVIDGNEFPLRCVEEVALAPYQTIRVRLGIKMKAKLKFGEIRSLVDQLDILTVDRDMAGRLYALVVAQERLTLAEGDEFGVVSDIDYEHGSRVRFIEQTDEGLNVVYGSASVK